MTARTAVPIAAALALAACNSQPEVNLKDAKPKEVASAVAAAGPSEQWIRPGKWQTVVKVEDISMPGMPPQMLEQMKNTVAKTDATDSCISAEEAKKPKPELFAGAQKNCTYDRFTMAGGNIDMQLTCKDGGASMTMTMAGSYSPDHYSARSEMKMAAGGTQGMTWKGSVEGKRVGECA